MFVKRISVCVFFVYCLLAVSQAQNPGMMPENPAPAKNVILMIPDGTSTSVLSLSRWYSGYGKNGLTWLNLDQIITGLVRTHCSDSPIGDSAPTGSTYATGIVSQADYVATYPEESPNDIFPVDRSMANKPAMTILEAAKLKGMATGLAVTCYFTHATPADFSAHSYSRERNDWLAMQMIYNQIDVVFGGGVNYLMPGHRQYLVRNGWDVIIKDYDEFKAFQGRKVWGLFADYDLPYDIDRNPSITPSLAEMTKKAIEILSQNENGFFLMVEGSKIDYAAHDNDATGVITEFIAFDQAVKEALDFAKRDGKTVVVICPDHGTGAISMGNEASNTGYAKLSKKQLLGPLVECKYTAEGFASILMNIQYDESIVKRMFLSEMGIIYISDQEMLAVKHAMERKNTGILKSVIIQMFKTRSFIGFTTGGHTGEDVFLACYHPQNHVLSGVVENTEINKYICKLLGIESLTDSTKKYFAGHKDLFPTGQYNVKWDKNDLIPSLTVTNKKTKRSFTVNAFENKADVRAGKRQTIRMNTVVVYVDKNEEFYLPRGLKDLID